MAQDCTTNFIKWASGKGFADGPLFPMNKTIERLVSCHYINPGILASYSIQQVNNDFSDMSINVFPEVLQLPSVWHFLTRIHCQAVQENSQAHTVSGHISAPQGFPPQQPAQPNYLSIADSRSDALAKAITLMAESSKEKKKRQHQYLAVTREELSDNEDDYFDLPSFVAKENLQGLDSNWFVSVQRLGNLDRFQTKAAKGKPSTRPHFLSDLPIEDWIPAWVGTSLDPSCKASLIKSWKSSLRSNQSENTFLSCLTTFWLSHSAVGIVKITSVMSHLLLIIKMISEHDLQYAVQYVRQLQQFLLRHIKSAGTETIDHYLLTPQFSITHDLDILINSRRLPYAADSAKDRRTRDRHGKQPPTPVGTAPKAAPKPRPNGTSGGKNFTSTDYVCFLHHPAGRLSCRFGDKCKKQHLDTSDVALLTRWVNAAESFNKKTPSKAVTIPKTD